MAETVLPNKKSTSIPGYVETMFFDEGELTRHLYIVYMDGRIMRLDVGDNQQSQQFCASDSYHMNPEKYNGLDDVMRGYRYTEGDDYAIMYGNIDAYLLARNAFTCSKRLLTVAS